MKKFLWLLFLFQSFNFLYAPIQQEAQRVHNTSPVYYSYIQNTYPSHLPEQSARQQNPGNMQGPMTYDQQQFSNAMYRLESQVGRTRGHSARQELLPCSRTLLCCIGGVYFITGMLGLLIIFH